MNALGIAVVGLGIIAFAAVCIKDAITKWRSKA